MSDIVNDNVTELSTEEEDFSPNGIPAVIGGIIAGAALTAGILFVQKKLRSRKAEKDVDVVADLEDETPAS